MKNYTLLLVSTLVSFCCNPQNSSRQHKDITVPEIFYNITYINEAYEKEKALGSEKIPILNVCEFDFNRFAIDHEESVLIYSKPGPRYQEPMYAIFKRKEPYEFPLYVIYIYNSATRVVSHVCYEWQPYWTHCKTDSMIDNEVKKWKEKFADEEFYRQLFFTLYKDYCRKNFGVPWTLSFEYDLAEEIKEINYDLDNFNLTHLHWDKEDYSVALSMILDDINLEIPVFYYTGKYKKEYRNVVLSFFLKKNIKSIE